MSDKRARSLKKCPCCGADIVLQCKQIRLTLAQKTWVNNLDLGELSVGRWITPKLQDVLAQHGDNPPIWPIYDDENLDEWQNFHLPRYLIDWAKGLRIPRGGLSGIIRYVIHTEMEKENLV